MFPLCSLSATIAFTLALKNARSGDKLPVLIYLHGGGICIDSKSRAPFFSYRRSVERVGGYSPEL